MRCRKPLVAIMAGIFISYRRSNAGGHAGRLSIGYRKVS